MNEQLSKTTAPPQAARAAMRVLDILELLARKPSGLTLSEVAAELAVPISSLHPLMRAMEARRYLVRAPDRRRFCLGPQLPEVSRGYLNPDEPFATARLAMRQVAERCGETVHIAVLSGREVEYIDGTTARNPLSAQSHIGQRFPAHTTAAGKALLGAFSPDSLAALYGDESWPESTLDSQWRFDALQRELDEVRWTGYARDIDAIERGLQCLAVTLPNLPGRPRTALNISVPTVRLQGDGFWNLARILRDVGTPPIVGRVSLKKHPLVGWSLSNTGDNPVYVQMYQSANEVMERYGGKILWTNAPNEHKQADDVRRLLEEPLDALIIHPTNAVATAPLFEMTRPSQKLLVCFHRPARTRAFDFFVGSDVYVRGCLQAHAAARLLHGHGGVFVVEGGVYDDNARSISQGTRDTLATYPGLRLIGSQPSELWSPQTARSIVREALDTFERGSIRAIIAANDEMAIGIADLLAAQGLADQIALIGGDGDDRTVEMIRAGTLAGTVLQDAGGMGAAALDYVARVLQGAASVDDLPRRSLFHAPEGHTVRALDISDTWIDRTNLSVLEDYWAEHKPHSQP